MQPDWQRFKEHVERATGLAFDDVIALAEEQERLNQERIREAGYCCEAGFLGAPDPCRWHPEHQNRHPYPHLIWRRPA